MAATAREATTEAEAAEQMRVRAGEAAAVRRKGQKKAIQSKKVATAAAERVAAVERIATTTTMGTPVEERRAAMKGISAQFTHHSKNRNSALTTNEMEKYRTKNRPWDQRKVIGVRGTVVSWREHTWLRFGFIATQG